MKSLILVFSILFSFGVIAQTKVIAFKSHSGSMNQFGLALANPKMDLMNHNLGEGPQPTVRSAVLDSVIFISETKAVMVTSFYCQNSEWYYGGDTTVDYETRTLWRPGKDTVLNHPLFSHQHSLDSIKEVMQTRYNFRNDEDSTVFIGYDNMNVKLLEPMMDEDRDQINDNEKDENSAPVIGTPSNPSGGIGIIVSSLLLASFLIGFASWWMSKRRISTVNQA
jgi:hypothetical protein